MQATIARNANQIWDNTHQPLDQRGGARVSSRRFSRPVRPWHPESGKPATRRRCGSTRRASSPMVHEQVPADLEVRYRNTVTREKRNR
jgi:hypothetical protein